tara:strand:- start:4952 stop:5470 length:519 start_codon:yes stop_codon:yes gene_type:complete
MPNTYLNIISSDKIIYDFINKINKKYICFLEPNHVTLFNMLVTVVIGYLLYYKYNIKLLLLLTVFRGILDCLDGGIARKCNKMSKLGKYLDIIGDFFFTFTIIIILLKNINIKYNYLKKYIYIICLYIIYGSINVLFTNYDIFNKNFITKLIHDNLILIEMFYVFIITKLTY